MGLLILVGVGDALSALGAPAVYLVVETTSKLAAVGFAMTAVVLGAASPRSWRTYVLTGTSIVAYPFFLGVTSALVGVYALTVCALARCRLRVRYQVALALLAWATVPVCRWALPPHSARALPVSLMIVWAGLAYSAIYLLVERARRTEKSPLAEDIFYLVALPRILCPFFQPISPSYLRRHDRPSLSPASVAGAVALGAYAMVLGVIAFEVERLWKTPRPALLEIPAGIVITYCTFGRTIFTAASLFRLMGFEISSGMHQPFRARSFADFFARFNHYVRDAVLSLFFIPLFIRLRRRLSPRVAAMIAAYVAIFVGSFVLNQLLVPMATSMDWRAALTTGLSPVTTLTMVLYWTAIILPSANFEPRPRTVAGGGRWAEVARFLVLYVGLWAAMWLLRNWHRLVA
jgi:hypothetical protein